MWFRRKTKATLESEKALEDAKKNLERVQERNEEITEIAESLRKMRERNHFAETLVSIIAPFEGTVDDT